MSRGEANLNYSLHKKFLLISSILEGNNVTCCRLVEFQLASYGERN
jgi:hypothetical protein